MLEEKTKKKHLYKVILRNRNGIVSLFDYEAISHKIVENKIRKMGLDLKGWVIEKIY